MERREGKSVRRSVIKLVPIALIEGVLFVQSTHDETHETLTFALLLSPLTALFLLDFARAVAARRGSQDPFAEALTLPIRILGAVALLMGIILAVWIPVRVVLSFVDRKWSAGHMDEVVGAAGVAVGLIFLGWAWLRRPLSSREPFASTKRGVTVQIGGRAYALDHVPDLSSLGPRAAAVASQEASHSQPVRDPSEVEAARRLGDFYRAQGKYDEAIEAYQDGLTVDPSNAELRALIDQMKKARLAG